MNCPNCNTENPTDASFCSQCGAALTTTQEESSDVQEPADEAAPQSALPEPPPVLQDMEFGSFSIRLAAFAIDLVIVIAVLALVGLFLGAVALLVWPVYFIYLTGKTGQTVGKLVLGLKVVGHTGEVPHMGQLFRRELYRFGLYLLATLQDPVLGIFAGIIAAVLATGFVAVFFDPLRRGWHDRLARTYVVRVPRLRYIPPPR